MRKPLIALLLVIAACSPAETAESTTTSTTVRIPTTSTTRVPTTTTLPTTTTTTLAPTTTTTTIAPTTTTANLLPGNWADEPLITTDFGSLGWWDGSDWLSAEIEGALPVVGGEDYQTVVGSSLGRTTGGPQTTVCEPIGLIGVELANPGLLGELPGPYGVAISAPWPLQPHLFSSETDDGTFADVARRLLSDRGLDVATPVVKQVIRTDLEGDGINEVLVAVEEVSPGLLLQPGDYSIVFMQKVVEGGVQTATLEETVVLGEQEQFAGAHSIGTLADLNGDGKMEMVVSSVYFEGFGVSIWEYVDDDFGPTPRLQVGCGS